MKLFIRDIVPPCDCMKSFSEMLYPIFDFFYKLLVEQGEGGATLLYQFINILYFGVLEPVTIMILFILYWKKRKQRISLTNKV